MEIKEICVYKNTEQLRKGFHLPEELWPVLFLPVNSQCFKEKLIIEQYKLNQN